MRALHLEHGIAILGHVPGEGGWWGWGLFVGLGGGLGVAGGGLGVARGTGGEGVGLRAPVQGPVLGHTHLARRRVRLGAGVVRE